MSSALGEKSVSVITKTLHPSTTQDIHQRNSTLSRVLSLDNPFRDFETMSSYLACGGDALRETFKTQRFQGEHSQIHKGDVKSFIVNLKLTRWKLTRTMYSLENKDSVKNLIEMRDS